MHTVAKELIHRANEAVIMRQPWRQLASHIGGQSWKRILGEFTQPCIHCIFSRSGELIPRPLSSALHDTNHNEVVHTDFLYMEPADRDEFKYILVITDDISVYSWLYLPTLTATQRKVL